MTPRNYDDENAEEWFLKNGLTKKKVKKFTRSCLGVDCNNKFSTYNRLTRLCESCRDSEVYRYGQNSKDDLPV